MLRSVLMTARLFFLGGILLSVPLSVFSQDLPVEERLGVTLESLEKASSTGEYRITLKGVSKEKEGTLLNIQLVPIRRGLREDRWGFLPATTDIGAGLSRTTVGKGGEFRFTCRIPHLREHELRVSPALSPGILPARERLHLVDPGSLSENLSEEIQTFLKNRRAIDGILRELEPHQETEKPAPLKLGRRVMELYARLKGHAEERTVFTASADLLLDLVGKIIATVAFGGGEGEETPVAGGVDPDDAPGYAPPPVVKAKTFRVREWVDLLEKSSGAALREGALVVLEPVMDRLERASRREEGSSGRPVRDLLRASSRAFPHLKKAVSEETWKEYSAMPDLEAVLSGAEEALEEPLPSGGAPDEGIRKLHQDSQRLRERLLRDGK